MVKDPSAFEGEMQRRFEGDVEIEKSADGSICLLAATEDGDWPIFEAGRDDPMDHDVWIPEIVAPHLAEDQVAIFLEINAGDPSRVRGLASAVNNKGETRDGTVDEIYGLARELGSSVTRLEK